MTKEERRISEELKGLRDKTGYSRERVAQGVGKSAKTIERWENSGHIGPAELRKLRHFYDMELDPAQSKSLDNDVPRGTIAENPPNQGLELGRERLEKQRRHIAEQWPLLSDNERRLARRDLAAVYLSVIEIASENPDAARSLAEEMAILATGNMPIGPKPGSQAKSA
ncbi:MAG TPA: helix-turn-helix transcriptional regulator [Gemmatimonadaceae bacterium]|nr:helix-turn-helix transcriptional regulator [Gemmatimonadaceae bacterium]